MTGTITRDDEAASFAAYQAIAAPLQRYIDAARSGDGAGMREACLDTARIRGSYDGKPVDWSLAEFCALIDQGGPAVGLATRIVTIEHAGTAAMARLEAENWRGTRYTDFFVLLKIGADWRIASKVFFAHSRA
ncbi:MAG: nuclear transport factor 2 family protein [Proteobacteria bacterium]|nr:nuclear transport factor 2 family protein [Pseudomonadota bacterium]